MCYCSCDDQATQCGCAAVYTANGNFFILSFASQDIAEDLDCAEFIYFTIDLRQKDDNPLNSVKIDKPL